MFMKQVDMRSFVRGAERVQQVVAERGNVRDHRVLPCGYVHKMDFSTDKFSRGCEKLGLSNGCRARLDRGIQP